jgi:hypothetical protein
MAAAVHCINIDVFFPFYFLFHNALKSAQESVAGNTDSLQHPFSDVIDERELVQVS